MPSLNSILKILVESRWNHVNLLPTIYGNDLTPLQIPNYKSLNRVIIETKFCAFAIDIDVKYLLDEPEETFIFSLKEYSVKEANRDICKAVWKPIKRLEDVYSKEVRSFLNPPREIYFYTDRSYLKYKHPIKNALEKCVAIEFIKKVNKGNIRLVLSASQETPFHIDIAINEECEKFLKGNERFEINI